MKSILIIDDDKVLSGLLQMTLELEGYRVATAEDGDVGLQALKAQNYDLVILDLVMPRIDGIKFLRLLHDSGAARPPIVVLSSALGADGAEQFRALGVVDAVRKPVEPDRLIAIVATALAGAA